MDHDFETLDLAVLKTVSGGDAAGMAVQAARSRLGSPYVWGGCGPNQFDCSGLVRWAYGQAGVQLDGNSSQLSHSGMSVPQSQARPGDLVFPHAGHVQLYIGNGQVIEAPGSGGSVQISSLAGNAMIRRVV